MKFPNQANVLVALRVDSGLTQKELANRVGYNVQFISNIERGVCGIPAKKVKKFAKVLRCPTLRIFFDSAVLDFLEQLKKEMGYE